MGDVRLVPESVDAVEGAVPAPSAPLLSVRGLQVDFFTERGEVHALQDVSWEVRAGETLGVVGESGSGKSVTALSVMGLLPPTAQPLGGEIQWRGQVMDAAGLERLRGSRITMIFQDPMASLNPLVTVGHQIGEVLARHKGMSRRAARARAAELLDLVGIPEPVRRLRQYPFEMSGGMAQRVMIAMALAPEPDLLIADEPTTALDVTIQAQILDLVTSLQEELGIAMILITHDLGVVAGVANRIVVMYGGRVMEEGSARAIFEHPSHPYTEGLLASTPHPFDVQDRLVPIVGNPPVVTEVVPGCGFRDRCPYRTEICAETRPGLAPPEDPATAPGNGVPRKVACWHAR